jgi:hypothetical protein
MAVERAGAVAVYHGFNSAYSSSSVWVENAEYLDKC